ncbi:MAG: PQQ-binding-like beta-propeller repeat protein [Chloroflexota bacterium]
MNGARARASRSRRIQHLLPQLAILVLLLAGCSSGSAPSTPAALPIPTAVLAHSQPKPAPPLRASLTTWRLPVPIGRAVVLPGKKSLLVAGGLQANGGSTSGVQRISLANGTVTPLGSLAQPVHDAAGAVLGGKLFVFGGGSSTSIAASQSFSPSSGGKVVGSLPAARSDLTSVSTGGNAYLLGGYDGLHLSPTVLATRDGVHFVRAGKLPLPVRYAAAATLYGRLFIFGGTQGIAGISAIQEVNPLTHRAQVVGHLPVKLSHAVACALGNYIYIVGGRIGGSPTRRMWSFDPSTFRVRRAGALPMSLADAGIAVVGNSAYLAGGEDATGPQPEVVRLRVAGPGQPASAFPFNGRLLIADRGNNRLLLVNAGKKLLWSYPSVKRPAPPGGFYFPDDAFFANHGRSIVINEEENEAVVRIAYPSGKLQWSYGHPGVIGSTAGYLHEPDDAYLLKNGQIVVADDGNCRVIFLSPAGKIVHQIGTIGECTHQPPTALGAPNGDTPLANGDVLISEINGSWISEYTPTGKAVWTVHLPISYPSDPQQIGPDRYLVADYSTPGGLFEFDRSGKILWSYAVPSGLGMLDHPSLAERLPNGLLIGNDDYRHRIAVINPVTQTIVWQYGQTDIAGTSSGYLNTPDGLDIVTATGRTPTHLATR